jgi:hypothetical protein
VSKTFTAAAIEKLAKDGKLRSDDPLSRYVNGIPNGDSITIEQLLLHESGVGVLDSEEIYRDCLSRQEVVRRLASAKPLFHPGKESRYSNEGYFLLAAVIERVTGGSYGEFLRNNFFARCRWKIQEPHAGIFLRAATRSEVWPLPRRRAYARSLTMKRRSMVQARFFFKRAGSLSVASRGRHQSKL